MPVIFRRAVIRRRSRHVGPLSKGSTLAAGAIDVAAGVATASAIVGESTARSAISSGAGVATASAIAGRSTARAAFGIAAGAATTGMAGESTAVATIGTAAGAARFGLVGHHEQRQQTHCEKQTLHLSSLLEAATQTRR